jgi:phage recombination protein Bet
MTNQLATVPESGGALALSEEEFIEVLQTSVYPGASLPSIKMAIAYCKAASLDPLQKPVHIVPMWDKNTKQMRDVIMPGVGLYRTQAARSNALAGIGEPVFGPVQAFQLGSATFYAPEWASVTVKRLMPNGAIADYVAVEYWIENYATAGKDSEMPNAMWKKRPRGQLGKCAQAQALRLAFPEMTGSAPTADEMEGKYIDSMEVDITPRPQRENAIAIAQQAAAVENNEERERLIADLDAVADNGMEALKAAWTALTSAQKKMHGGLSDATKAKASRADEFMGKAE